MTLFEMPKMCNWYQVGMWSVLCVTVSMCASRDFVTLTQLFMFIIVMTPSDESCILVVNLGTWKSIRQTIEEETTNDARAFHNVIDTEKRKLRR